MQGGIKRSDNRRGYAPNTTTTTSFFDKRNNHPTIKQELQLNRPDTSIPSIKVGKGYINAVMTRKQMIMSPYNKSSLGCYDSRR
jgi:hypothetical protein